MKYKINIVSIIIYILLQCTWGMLQTIVGFVAFLIYIKKSHSFYKGCIRTNWPIKAGVSLGLFIFVSEDCDESTYSKMSIHEYGHTLQSLVLGPFYLLLIGLPSLIWFYFFDEYRRRKQQKYASFFIEKWADTWGEKIVK